jgi:hypothetical protein
MGVGIDTSGISSVLMSTKRGVDEPNRITHGGVPERFPGVDDRDRVSEDETVAPSCRHV